MDIKQAMQRLIDQKSSKIWLPEIPDNYYYLEIIFESRQLSSNSFGNRMNIPHTCGKIKQRGIEGYGLKGHLGRDDAYFSSYDLVRDDWQTD